MPDTTDTGGSGVGEERLPLGFADLYASPGDHIGHFYQTAEEWKELLIPFLQKGMQAGEKCVYFMEPGSRWEELREGLADAGGDVDGAIASGQLVLDEGRGD
ncbi:MAG: MEDS domain-containing protein, partial [Gemmatimonadetes bacterium]|nr:MEDS domain-containing protein [Gemmatimonadota bacterium]